MSLVANMVCTDCGRRHGRPHHPDCPHVSELPDEELTAYTNGWLKACAMQADEIPAAFKLRWSQLLDKAGVFATDNEVDAAGVLATLRLAAEREGVL